MNRGILLCAHDSDVFWYGRMAYSCSLMIREHMGDYNIALVTDPETWERLLEAYPRSKQLMRPVLIERPNDGNRRPFTMAGVYHNSTRSASYSLSPFDETLVIDADMLILDDRLNLVWGSNNDFMMNTQIGRMVFPHSTEMIERRFKETGVPLYWATVFYFRKTPAVQDFFQVVNYVKINYNYFGLLHGYNTAMYRNDYAFSVAAHFMGGRTEGGFVKPLPIPYLTFAWDRDKMIHIERGRAVFKVDGSTVPVTSIESNVHFMNKYSYEEFAERIIEAYA